jgi:DNA/RNA endonuclease YhcR with UshA esterase domain
VKTARILALALIVVTCEVTQAHHFVVTAYDVSKTVSLEGDVVQFLFRKPHSFVQMKGHDETGRTETWLVEWNDGSLLSRSGLEFDTLKTGDHVIVTGNPSRHPGERKVHLVTILRQSDRWQWKDGG